MKFLNDEEARELLRHAVRYDAKSGTVVRIGEVGESKLFPGLRFWNAAGRENCLNYPTFYFRGW